MDLCTKYLKVGMDLTNGPVILYQDDKEVGLVHQGKSPHLLPRRLKDALTWIKTDLSMMMKRSWNWVDAFEVANCDLKTSWSSFTFLPETEKGEARKTPQQPSFVRLKLFCA